ncbi:MAG TPA: hypothetical protein VH143_14895 [Kofleriaceae bacterium]|nr:hypothetical protein [Kofleriaceae bacterium]
MPWIGSHVPFGMPNATARPAASGNIGSRVPWITSPGTEVRASSGRRSPDASTAANWRKNPRGFEPRSNAAMPIRRMRASSSGHAGLPSTRNIFTSVAPDSSAFRGGGENSARSARGSGRNRRAPGVDMIDVKLRIRGACSIARCCATIPPSDAPTTCTAAKPSASHNPITSRAISDSVYGAWIGRLASRRASSGNGRGTSASRCVDSPTSRASKRTT